MTQQEYENHIASLTNQLIVARNSMIAKFWYEELLHLVAKHDMCGSIGWTEDLTFYVNCNDMFSYSSADARSDYRKRHASTSEGYRRLLRVQQKACVAWALRVRGAKAQNETAASENV